MAGGVPDSEAQLVEGDYEIQVLTPMRKGLLGVERLNQILQRYLNPPDEKKKEKEIGQRLFREGDKVMQVKNNYQLEWEILGRYKIPVDKGVGVFNGDTGIMTEINEFAETATVEFEDGRQAEYSFKQLGVPEPVKLIWRWQWQSRRSNAMKWGVSF